MSAEHPLDPNAVIDLVRQLNGMIERLRKEGWWVEPGTTYRPGGDEFFKVIVTHDRPLFPTENDR